MQMTPRSTADLRRANRNRVYRFLYEAQQPQTKQSAAQALNMSMPTLNQNISELLEMGLVDDSKIADSTGGRKPHILSIIPDARFALGAEISPHHIRVLAADMELRVLGHQSLKRTFEPSEEYARGLAQDVEDFLQTLQLDCSRLLGVGIALPGLVDEEQGTLERASVLGVKRMNLKILAQYIPYPVRFCNDASAGGFAEWWKRADLANMAYLSVGRGVGGAILINGQPYEGTNRRSGEFGHVCIHPQGKLCSCGRRGCLEAYCSTALLSDDQGITMERFFEQLRGADPSAACLWGDYLDDLAAGIANLHTALDCDIVLGGLLSQYLKEWMPALKQRLKDLDPFQEEADYLHLCRYYGQSNRMGAALRFIDAFLAQI